MPAPRYRMYGGVAHPYFDTRGGMAAPRYECCCGCACPDDVPSSLVLDFDATGCSLPCTEARHPGSPDIWVGIPLFKVAVCRYAINYAYGDVACCKTGDVSVNLRLEDHQTYGCIWRLTIRASTCPDEWYDILVFDGYRVFDDADPDYNIVGSYTKMGGCGTSATVS